MRNLLAIALLSATLLSGCSKDEEAATTPTLPPANTNTSTLSLTYPVNATNLNPCCIDFTWDSDSAASYHFQLARDESFNNILKDTVVTVKNFLYTGRLIPNTPYYWRIQADTMERTASFRVKDVLQSNVGTYTNARIEKYFWQSGQGTQHLPTRYDTVHLTQEGSNFRFTYPDDNINSLLEYNPNVTEPNLVGYWSFQGPAHVCRLEKNFVTNDSITVRYSSGGLAGATEWIIRFKQ